MKPDPNIRYGRLENGMRFAIRARKGAGNGLSVRMRFNVGSLMESDSEIGAAHFLEHMAFNGSENVQDGEMTKILERHGLSFGKHTNAYTAFDETVYKLDAPSADNATQDTFLFLMREVADRLTIDQEAVATERDVILSEARARDGSEAKVNEERWRTMLPKLRFGYRAPIGTVEGIRSITAQQLRDFYRSFYRPGRALLVVVGDIDPDQVERRIRASFGDWVASGQDPADPDFGSIGGGADVSFVKVPNIATTVSLMSFREPDRRANNEASVKKELQRAIGNAILSRRLNELSTTGSQPFVSAQVSGEELLGTVDISSVEVATSPSRWEGAAAIVKSHIDEALDRGFTQSEVEKEVGRMSIHFRSAALHADERSSANIADEIIGEFGRWSVDMAPADELDVFERFKRTVSADAVNQAFRSQWDASQIRVFLATDGDAEGFHGRARSVVRNKSVPQRSHVSGMEIQRFAYETFGREGVVVDRNTISDLGIVTLRFSNNVRLNVKQTRFANDEILVTVRYGSGLLEMPVDKPGLAVLYGATQDGGLREHSAAELNRWFAGRSVSMRFVVGEDAFVISGRTTKADLDLQLKLMAAFVVAPGYRDEGLSRLRQGIRSEAKAMQALPGGTARRHVQSLLRSGDPKYLVPELDEILARNFDELREATARARERGAIEIGIVGDVDERRAIEVVADTFGALAQRVAVEPMYRLARHAVFPKGTSSPKILYHADAQNRAMALVFWPTRDDSEPYEVRKIELLRAILAARLNERLREEEGLTYSPSTESVFSRVSPDFGYIGVSVDVLPQNIERAFGSIDDVVAQIAKGGVTEDELERARRPILGQFRIDNEGNPYWSFLAATAQSDPLLLAKHRLTMPAYQAVTTAEVTSLAGKYLQRERAYRVAVIPEGGAAAPAE